MRFSLQTLFTSFAPELQAAGRVLVIELPHGNAAPGFEGMRDFGAV
jgi:hypothetical protein